MKVLIVDDEEEICKRLQRELQKEGYVADYTTSPVSVMQKLREAKKKGRENAYELLTLNIQMPQLSGFELLKQIREAHLDLDVIVITGYGGHETAIEALKLGTFNYLKKPISLDELITSVGKGVDVLGLRRGLSARRRELEIEGGLKERYTMDLESAIKEIEKEKNYTRHLIESSPDFQMTLDKDGKIMDVNKAFEEVVGTSRENIIGEFICKYFPERECEKVEKVIAKIVEKKKVRNIELTAEIPDKGTFIVDLSGTVFTTPEGEEGVYVAGRDLTERKELEEKLRRSERLAAIGELSGNVAHELRQPLGVISSAIYYLKMTLTEADETTREYLDMINNEVKSAGDVITGLLEIARTRQAEREEMEVSSVIEKALEKFDMPENITLNKDIPEDIPAISVDPGQMGQVFYNLINNAIQAMSMPEREGRGGELTINVKSRKKKGKARVEVSFGDTGVGISKENMKKLFEPLFTTKSRGVGLGLSICNLTFADSDKLCKCLFFMKPCFSVFC